MDVPSAPSPLELVPVLTEALADRYDNHDDDDDRDGAGDGHCHKCGHGRRTGTT